jgi:hypothetical protein
MYETDIINDLLVAEDRGKAEERRKNVEHMFSERFSVDQVARKLGIPEKEYHGIVNTADQKGRNRARDADALFWGGGVIRIDG